MLDRKCVEMYINLLCASLDIVPPRVHYGVKEMQSETTIAQATRAGGTYIYETSGSRTKETFFLL